MKLTVTLMLGIVRVVLLFTLLAGMPGGTLLHCVTYQISIIIMSGKEAVVEFLLSECNVQSNCTTEKGLTPLSLTNNSTIIDLLRQHGAVVDTHLHPDSLSDADTMTSTEKPG